MYRKENYWIHKWLSDNCGVVEVFFHQAEGGVLALQKKKIYEMSWEGSVADLGILQIYYKSYNVFQNIAR